MKVFKTDSEIHKKVEELFETMNKMGISVIPYSGNNFFNIDGKDVKIVDAESGREVMEYPPFCEFRVALAQ